MKKVFSILMCTLLLYNIMGFPLVYWIGEYFADGHSGELATGDILPEELLVLKIPIMVPYQTDWQVAEQAEGRLRRGDDFYQIVEQQLMNDTLYVKCKLDISAKDRYLDLVSHVDKHVKGGVTDGKGKAPQMLKNFLKDYLTFNRKYWFFVIDWIRKDAGFKGILLTIPSLFLYVASPPPKAAF
ncbi:hypothetical protein [Dyadobacter fermentans]|uniref:hypothetical protein n=1 Tax=Dyadobacter fermentans TaxID=94254 RepID=UPI001CC10F7D|nr:hypothetical protein [Dyadobacter fermentans]MBZ1360446.1 hypothetical protein [Dyadobacter fermentans]